MLIVTFQFSFSTSTYFILVSFYFLFRLFSYLFFYLYYFSFYFCIFIIYNFLLDLVKNSTEFHTAYKKKHLQRNINILLQHIQYQSEKANHVLMSISHLYWQTYRKLPSSDHSIIHTPDIIQDKLHKQRFLSFGLWRQRKTES